MMLIDNYCIADDEPDDGPTCYIIMTGFTSLDLLKQMSPVGLTAHVLMNITGGSVPPIDHQINGEKIKKCVTHKMTYTVI